MAAHQSQNIQVDSYSSLNGNKLFIHTNAHFSIPRTRTVCLCTAHFPRYCRFVLSHASNPHAFRYQDGYYPVNEKRVPIQLHPLHLTHNGGVTVGNRSADTLELYHYMTKSMEEYKKKVGSATKWSPLERC